MQRVKVENPQHTNSTRTHLGEVGSLAGLVLGHLVKSVLAALLTLAKGLSFFGHVNHLDKQHTQAHTLHTHSRRLTQQEESLTLSSDI